MCCTAKKLTLPLSSLSLLFSVTTNAQTCVKVDDDNSPAAIVSGRITTHHKLPKGSEQRTGDGPWLILDQPLLADHMGIGSCYKWRKIAILTGEQSQIDYSQIRSPSGLTSRVISFGSLTCSAMLFHSASIAALPFTMPEPGGNAVGSAYNPLDCSTRVARPRVVRGGRVILFIGC